MFSKARCPRLVAPAALLVGMVVALVAAGTGPLPLSADGTSYGTRPVGGAAQQASGDYDADNDGLIEIRNLAQLDAVRYDLDGDGASDDAAYSAAFPNAMTGVGCPADGCVGYELATDLDFDTNGNGEADAGDSYWNDGAGWLPIGGMSFPPFTAAFDGAGHSISNLFINRYVNPGDADHIGLFGMVGSGGIIGQVHLEAANVSGCDAVGALVGTNGGVITDSYATGRVYGDQIIGGLVGANGGSITDSHSTGDVSGNRSIGGLVGTNGGPISGSYATGDVSGDDHVGGLVGANNSSITDSIATGSVSGDDYVGGLVGLNNSSITDSIATGSVSGDDLVGGLVGDNDSGGIVASYAAGSTSGDYTVGGLVGANSRGAIVASYSVGSVLGRSKVGGLAGRIYSGGTIIASYTAATVSGRSYVGGLVGYGRGTIELSYWDTDTTGQTRSVGGEGKTTQELQSPTDYTGIYAAWNIDLDNADGDGNLATGGDNLWHFGSSSDYPTLRNAVLPLGDPTGLRVVTVGDGQVTLEWQPGSNADAHWVVWLQYDSAGSATVVDVLLTSGDSSLATVTGLENGQSYVFVVFASRNVEGRRQLSAPSNLVPVTVEQDQITSAAVPQLYWVDEEAQRIQRTAGENGARTVEELDLVNAEGESVTLDMPGSIALDPIVGKMYWTDDGTEGESDGRIRRADLDGSNVEDLVSGLADPVGIALDLRAGRLYWADRHQGAIYRGALRDISPSGLLLDHEALVANLDRPYQIALDTFNGHMYWTERGENTSKIRRADLDGNNVTDIEFGLVVPLNPFGLALDPVAGRMYWSERSPTGGEDVIARADLDGGNGAIVISSAYHSLSGIAVDVNDGRVYWTDEQTGTIRRTDPADAIRVVETVVSGLSAPEGIAVSGPYLSSTRLALTALYRSTDGPNWTNSYNWLSAEHPGTWRGVTTDENSGVVEEMDLSDNGLVGELPAMLGNLNHLRNLDLSSNQLTGSIPSAWRDGFEVLRLLDLSENQLSGSIPAGLGNHHLARLNLSDNQLTGEIPTELGSLVSLEGLNLSSNRLNGPVPYQLSSFDDLAGCETIGQTVLNELAIEILGQYAGRLAKLETLDLSSNELHEAIPPMLCSLANLQVLDLAHNRLNGTIPKELGKLAELRTLSLDNQSYFRGQNIASPAEIERHFNDDGNYLYGTIPPELGDLDKLEALTLSDNRLNGSIPGALGGLLTVRSPLQTLDLSHNRLTGAIPVELGRLKYLTSLNLSHNQLEERIPQNLGIMVSLETLDLSQNRLSDMLPTRLGELSNLQWLDLGDNLLGGQIPSSLGGLYSLQVLSLGGNQFTGCVSQWLQTKLQSIEESDFDQLGLSVCAVPTTPAPTETDRDRHALLALYHATDGDHWYNSQRNQDKWQVDNPGSPIGDWYGVTIGPQGRVTEIDLQGNNLTGEIPKALTSLDQLTSLNLLANDLSGCIPYGLGAAQLDGPYAATRDSIPEQLGTRAEDAVATYFAVSFAVSTFLAHELEAVNQDWGGWRAFAEESYGLGLPPCPPPAGRPEGWTAHQNSKTDAMALYAIHQYYVVDYDNEPNATNKLDAGGGWTPDFESYATDATSEGCPEDNPFKTVDRLWPLPNDHIHGVETRKIDGCHRVIALHLDKRGLEGGISPAIGHLGKLEVLNLSRNSTHEREHGGLSGTIPTELGNLTNLVKLSLNHNQLTGELPAQLGHLGNLTFLALNTNELEGGMPRELGNLTAIKHLKLVDSGLGRDVPACVPPPIRQNVAPSLLSLANLVSLPTAAAKFVAKRTGGPLASFVARQADDWGNWWKTEGLEGSIDDRAGKAAKLIVPEDVGHQNGELVRRATENVITDLADRTGDAVMGLAIGFLLTALTALEQVLTIFNFVSSLLAPIDFVIKPGSTAAWTRLGDVSLNCATLNPLQSLQ